MDGCTRPVGAPLPAGPDAYTGASGTPREPCAVSPRSPDEGETTTVAVKIRLKRMGKIRAPHYRIVVVDSRTKRDGRAIEEIGKYHPTEEPVAHRGRLRAGAVLARRRRAADRGRRGAPQDHRRLAEVQGPARAPRAPCRSPSPSATSRTLYEAAARRRAASHRRRPPKAPPRPRRSAAAKKAEPRPPRPGRRGPGRRGSGRRGDPGRRGRGRRGRRPPTARRPDRARRGARAPGPGIVDHPDDVVVRHKELRRGEVLEVRVHPDDLGRVIGRAGRTATAFRTVIGALAGGAGPGRLRRRRPRPLTRSPDVAGCAGTDAPARPAGVSHRRPTG